MPDTGVAAADHTAIAEEKTASGGSVKHPQFAGPVNPAPHPPPHAKPPRGTRLYFLRPGPQATEDWRRQRDPKPVRQEPFCRGAGLRPPTCQPRDPPLPLG